MTDLTSVSYRSDGGQTVTQLYKPWGEVRYSSGGLPTKYTFTGQYSHVSDFGLLFYNARWLDPYLNRWTQPDSIIPNPYTPLDWDRYQYARSNPLKYTDPSGHMVTTGNDHEAGCKTPGSPRCILNKYYGVSTDDEWKMDLELYYYQKAYPEYEATTDPYLTPTQVMDVIAPTTRAGCANGSFWSCFAVAIVGGFGTTLTGPAPYNSAFGQPYSPGFKTKDVIGDPDCPGCGYRLNTPNPSDILMPGGIPVGAQQGRDSRIRTVQTERELFAIFNALKANATPVTKPDYVGEGYLLPNGGFVGFRDSQRFGSTIDINIPGIPINKIHLPLP